ncbi:MAG: hypothetical protein ACHP65_03450 [Legionellales bacterium]
MTDFKIDEKIWIINFEVEDDFYLLSKQTITGFLDDKVECEDEFNTFHVAYADIYRTKRDAVAAMISRLKQMGDELDS